MKAIWDFHVQSVADETFGELAPLCDGKSIPAAAISVDAKKGIEFKRGPDQAWRVAMSKIPTADTAEVLKDVKFVACMDAEETITVGQCIPMASVNGGDIITYNRVQHLLPITVLDTKTAKILDEWLVPGKIPKDCDSYV